MIRWMCGVSLKERQPITALGRNPERTDDADYIKACTRLVVLVEANTLIGRPEKIWQNTVCAAVRSLKVDPRTSIDGKKWRARRCQPSSVWNNILKSRRNADIL